MKRLITINGNTINHTNRYKITAWLVTFPMQSNDKWGINSEHKGQAGYSLQTVLVLYLGNRYFCAVSQ